MKQIFIALRGGILAVLIACLAFGAQAAVQVTQFDPPLNISAYADAPANGLFNVLGVDFDANGEVDFRLAYGLGGIGAYLNAPVRFGQRVSGPGVAGRGGPVAGVPLGSVIGTNIVSFVATNFYAWSSGDTNIDDLTQPFGDHEATVIIANVVQNFTLLGTTSGGILFTNLPPISTVPIVSGDVVGRECAIAVQFNVNGEVHYGYIHCDFSNGAAGVIYGWAYETEPNVAIEAASLAPVAPQAKGPTGIVGFVESSLPGWTVGISTAKGVFVKSVQTDKDGSFKVGLKPGLYTVTSSYAPHPGPGQPLPNYIIIGPSKSVIVTKNRFTFIELSTSL